MSGINTIDRNNAFKVQPPVPRAKEETADGPQGFGDMFAKALGDVNQKHIAADQAVADLVAGKSQDIHNVMIATQKADIGFQLLMQVRNKVVGAYETIMRMQI